MPMENQQDSFEEGGFTFLPNERGYTVRQRGRELGDIVTMQEPTGRYCFRLGFDQRRSPKTFRGRIAAAEALKVITGLAREAERKRWPLRVLILRAWGL